MEVSVLQHLLSGSNSASLSGSWNAPYSYYVVIVHFGRPRYIDIDLDTYHRIILHIHITITTRLRFCVNKPLGKCTKTANLWHLRCKLGRTL